MPPSLIVATQGEHAARLKGDVSALLKSVLKTNPALTPQEAMVKVQQQLLRNNPFFPPENGKCYINNLPPKILAEIFRWAVAMQREEDEDEFEEIESEEEDEEDEGPTSAALLEEISTEDDDDDEDWEDDEEGDDDEEDEEYDEEEEEPPFEIVASQVCRLWRETALKTGDLWSTIFIDEPHDWSRYKLYLERAGSEPLLVDILIDGLNEDALAAEADITKLMDLIVPKAHQLRDLLISTNYQRDARQILKRLHEIPSVPLLQGFQFSCYEDMGDYEEFQPAALKEPAYLPFSGSAPRLQAVNLQSVHIDWDASISLLKNLSELELGYHTKDVLPSWTTFSTYLKSSPGLERLALNASGPSLVSFPQPPTTPLEVPSVRTLILRDHEPEYVLALARNIHLPNVQLLTLDCEGLSGNDYTEVAKTFSQPIPGTSNGRSLFQTLKSLELLGFGTIDEDVVNPVLDSLSGVKNLTLDCGDEEESAVKQLWKALEVDAKSRAEAKKTNQPLVGGPYLPELEGLRTYGVASGNLRRFLSRRISLGVPIKTLCIHPDDDVEEEDEDWFRENLEEFDYIIDSEDEDEEDEDEDEDEEEEEQGEPEEEQEEQVAVVSPRFRRGPQRRIRGAASSRNTTGLANLD